MANEEQTLIGQILLDNSIIQDLRVTKEHFQDKNCRKWFEQVTQYILSGISADIQILGNDYPEDVYEISKLTDIPTSKNWRYFETKIIDSYTRRKLRQLTHKITDWCAKKKIGEVIELARRDLTLIDCDNDTWKTTNITDEMYGYVTQLENRYNNRGTLPGLETGITFLDDIIMGLQKSKLYYIGARPSQGKSALLLNMACHIGFYKKARVGFISLENSKKEILTRIHAQLVNINSQSLLSGYINEAEFKKIMTAGESIVGTHFYLNDKPNATIGEVVAIAQNMRRLNRVDILFVDYLQLIEHTDRSTPKIERIARSSVAMKDLARELKIPVVVAAQLRRDAENRRPGLNDFSDSSQIEKDADVAILLYEKDIEDEKENWLLVEKNRDGRKGDTRIEFMKHFVKFVDYRG